MPANSHGKGSDPRPMRVSQRDFDRAWRRTFCLSWTQRWVLRAKSWLRLLVASSKSSGQQYG